MKKYAEIKVSSGEIIGIFFIQSEVEIETGVINGTLMVQEITSSLSDSDFMATQYWKDGSWHTRERCPAPHHRWENYEWVKDMDEFWTGIRFQRNGLLSSTDWTQVADNNLTDSEKEAWRLYRTALRDITTTYSLVEDESDVVWPLQPS